MKFAAAGKTRMTKPEIRINDEIPMTNSSGFGISGYSSRLRDRRRPSPKACADEDFAGFGLNVEGLVGAEARQIATDVLPTQAAVIAEEEEAGAKIGRAHV